MKTKQLRIFIPVALLWLAALILAGFSDLNISLRFADPMSVPGRILEIAGEPPAILFTSFNFSLIAACFLKRRDHGRRELVLAALSIVGMVGTIYYTVSATFDYIRDWRADLSLGFIGSASELFFTLLITALISALLLGISFGISSERLEKILKIAAHCVLAAALTLIIIWAFKLCWGRVRFRQLESYSDFTPFWHPNGYTGYFSFPSGHTANATVIFTLTYYLRLLPESKRKYKPLVYAALTLWVIILALSRVLVGAHYLSDVLCGGAITAAIVYFCRPRNAEPSSKENQ